MHEPPEDLVTVLLEESLNKARIEVPGPDDRPKRVPVYKTLIDPKTNKSMPKEVEWRFTGSVLSKPDPAKEKTVYGADLSGTLITIFPVTNDTVFQTALSGKDESKWKLETNKELLPKVGAPAKLSIEAK